MLFIMIIIHGIYLFSIAVFYYPLELTQFRKFFFISLIKSFEKSINVIALLEANEIYLLSAFFWNEGECQTNNRAQAQVSSEGEWERMMRCIKNIKKRMWTKERFDKKYLHTKVEQCTRIEKNYHFCIHHFSPSFFLEKKNLHLCVIRHCGERRRKKT